jgi:hypothetical protein
VQVLYLHVFVYDDVIFTPMRGTKIVCSGVFVVGLYVPCVHEDMETDTLTKVMKDIDSRDRGYSEYDVPSYHNHTISC